MSSARIVAVLAAVAVTSCATGPELFRPAEHATALSPEGYSAAEYSLGAPQADVAEAKVWSDGAYKATLDGQNATIIKVVLEIENHTDQPLSLDANNLYVDSASFDHTVLSNLTPARIEGNLVVPPQGRQKINAYFALPPNVHPQRISSFRVRWKVDSQGTSYVRRTPFLQNPEPEQYAYYYTPYYDPFLYDPFFLMPPLVVHPYAFHDHGFEGRAHPVPRSVPR